MLRTFGEFGLRVAQSVARVRHNLAFVPAKFEFQHDVGIVFGRCGRHFFQPVQIGKLGLHRFDQQSLAVGRGNTGEGDRHDQHRDFNVGLTLFGQAHIGKGTDGQR